MCKLQGFVCSLLRALAQNKWVSSIWSDNEVFKRSWEYIESRRDGKLRSLDVSSRNNHSTSETIISNLSPHWDIINTLAFNCWEYFWHTAGHKFHRAIWGVFVFGPQRQNWQPIRQLYAMRRLSQSDCLGNGLWWIHRGVIEPAMTRYLTVRAVA